MAFLEQGQNARVSRSGESPLCCRGRSGGGKLSGLGGCSDDSGFCRRRHLPAAGDIGKEEDLGTSPMPFLVGDDF